MTLMPVAAFAAPTATVTKIDATNLRSLIGIKSTNFRIEDHPRAFIDITLDIATCLISGVLTDTNGFKNNNVNRVSLGVQTFDKDNLSYLNRKHTKEDVFNTIKLLKEFNVNINFDIESKRITIPGNQEYKKIEYVVENDFSQASFFLSLGAISSLPITVEGLDMNSLQPDKNIISILQSMGVSLKIENDQITTKKSLIKKTTVSLDENPDLGPILMGISAFAEEDITFTNISRLRIKESDRVEAMRDNLEKLGVHLEIIDKDTCIVHPSKLKTPSKTLSSYNDHRIFMTLVLITHELKEVTIDDEKCVNKSYPTFLEDLKTIEKETTYE